MKKAFSVFLIVFLMISGCASTSAATSTASMPSTSSTDSKYISSMNVFGDQPESSDTENSITKSSPDSDYGPDYFIGNKNTKKFHIPSCSFLPEEHNRVYFQTYQEAIDEGYVPCQKCNPEYYK